MADKIRVLLTEKEVDERINEVAELINRDYEGKHVHLICILKGGVFFTCELAKRLTVPVSMDFMSLQFCQIKGKPSLFSHFLLKTFGWYEKNPYLCIRF